MTWFPFINMLLLVVLIVATGRSVRYARLTTSEIDQQHHDLMIMLKVLITELRARPCVTATPQYKTDAAPSARGKEMQ